MTVLYTSLVYNRLFVLTVFCIILGSVSIKRGPF